MDIVIESGKEEKRDLDSLPGVHRTCAETAAVSCGTSYASAVSTPLRWIFFFKRAIKLVTHVEPHASAVSLLKRAENSAI